MARVKARRLFAKIESVYGTDPTLAATDALAISDLDVSPLEIEVVDRELITGSLGYTAWIPGSRMSRATFSLDVAGSGVVGTAPRFGKLFRACAMSETVDPGVSVTYVPVSGSFESVALAYYADGRYHLLRGCRGSWSLEGSAKGVLKLSFTMDGLYTPPADLAVAAGDYGDHAPPVIFNAANTTPVQVHSYAACVESFSLDLANELVHRDLAGCSELIDITNRQPTGSVTIDRVTQAEYDYFAAITDQTLDVISLQHGQAAGNIFTVTMPSCNLKTLTTPDNEGFDMMAMDYCPNPVIENDEIVLAFT